MIVFLKYFLIYWLVTGSAALLIGIRNAKGPENSKKVEEFAKEFDMSERRTATIFYLGFFTLGFIALPVVAIRKLVELIKG